MADKLNVFVHDITVDGDDGMAHDEILFCYAGSPARTVGWRDPGFIHTSFLKNLWPNSVYDLQIFLFFFLLHFDINVMPYYQIIYVLMVVLMNFQIFIQAWSSFINEWLICLEQNLFIQIISISWTELITTCCNIW